MGLMNFGVPQYLVLALARHFGSDDFVETGTFRGDTAAWASSHFKRVTTVESSPELHAAASNRLSALVNVRCVLGSSEQCLPEILGVLEPNAVFWLDAHWCGDATTTAGKDSAFPLLGEIRAINQRGFGQLVLIDDARLFTNSFSPLYEAGTYPGIGEIVSLLNEGNKRYTIIADDVIVSIPAGNEAALWEILKDDPDRIWSEATRRVLRVMRGVKARFTSQ